jgi:hypothetical protein
VKKHLPGFTPPPADHNMLLLAETGNSPTKFADGQDRSMLRFGRGIGFSEDGAAVVFGGRQIPASPMGDIGYQATTRGGRQMDGVLEGKVRFKEINQAVGTVLQTGGLIALQAGLASNNRDMAIVGGVIALVGLAQMIMAESVKPNADVRHWTNLPDKVNLLTGKYTLPGPAIPVLPRKGKRALRPNPNRLPPPRLNRFRCCS